MKKLLLILCLSFNLLCLFGQNYQIKNVTYNIEGRTREKNIQRKFPIDKSIIFQNENDFLL